MERDDRRVLLLAAEPAAGLGLDDLRLGVVEAERPLQRLVDVVRALERAVDGRRRRPRAGTAIIALFSMYSCSWWPTRYVPSSTTSASAKPASRSPERDLVVGEDVVADERVEDRRERLGPRHDGAPWPPGASRGPAAARSASGSAWCWISPPTGTRTGWSSLIRRQMLSPGMSAAVTNDDLRPVEGRVEVEGEQAGMGVGRADRRPEPGAGEDEVVGVLRLAGELGGPFAAERAAAARAAGRDRHRRERRAAAGAEVGDRGHAAGSLLGRDDTTEDGRDGPESRVRTAPDRDPTGPRRAVPVGHRKGVPSPPDKGSASAAGGPYSPAATVPGFGIHPRVIRTMRSSRPSRIC